MGWSTADLGYSADFVESSWYQGSRGTDSRDFYSEHESTDYLSLRSGDFTLLLELSMLVSKAASSQNAKQA